MQNRSEMTASASYPQFPAWTPKAHKVSSESFLEVISPNAGPNCLVASLRYSFLAYQPEPALLYHCSAVP